jgi:hypothetical protein
MIASQELDAHLVGPAWGLNQRRYYRNFQTSRLDFLAEDFLARLPHHAFTEQDYLDSGEIDFGRAIRLWAEKRNLTKRGSFIVTVDGLYGGYPALWNARSMITAKLLKSRDTLKNIYEISSSLDRKKLFVAVHMRLTGDFTKFDPSRDVRGTFNLLVPGDWYLNVCENLRLHFGDRVEFRIFTDRGGPEYEDVVKQFSPGQTRQEGLNECSDLMLMSQADLRICSVSSYSLVASFLAGGPYVWYEPQLVLDDGFYTLWGREPEQRKVGSLTMQSRSLMQAVTPESSYVSSFRGYPAGRDGKLSTGLLKQMERKLDEKSTGNLLEYGAVPQWL